MRALTQRLSGRQCEPGVPVEVRWLSVGVDAGRMPDTPMNDAGAGGTPGDGAGAEPVRGGRGVGGFAPAARVAAGAWQQWSVAQPTSSRASGLPGLWGTPASMGGNTFASRFRMTPQQLALQQFASTPAQPILQPIATPPAAADFVRDQMGTEFEVAAAALAAGKHVQAASLAKAAHNSRRVEGARDLNRCYTNQAVTMRITAMSAMVSAVMIVNAGALTSQNRDRALRKLADVQADAHEALTGTLSTTGEPWILAGQDAHADAGLILRGNLQELDTIAQQLAAAVRGIPVTNRALSFD